MRPCQNTNPRVGKPELLFSGKARSGGFSAAADPARYSNIFSENELFQVDFVLSGLLGGLAREWRREEGIVDSENNIGSLVKGELERQLWPADQWPDLELADVLWRHSQRNSGIRLSLAAMGAAVGAAGVGEGLRGIHGILSL